MKRAGKTPLNITYTSGLITEFYANLNFTSVASVLFNERDEILALILSTAHLKSNGFCDDEERYRYLLYKIHPVIKRTPGHTSESGQRWQAARPVAARIPLSPLVKRDHLLPTSNQYVHLRTELNCTNMSA